MNEEAIKLLYEDIKDSYDVGSLDDFKNYLLDDNKRKMFFDQVIKPEYDVNTIDEFESVYGLKKKDELQPTSQKVVTESITEEKTTPTSLESSKNNFDYKDFLLKKEEEAKPFLEEALKGRDFSVEETGIGNALNVKDNVTGEIIEIDLRPAPITGNTMEQQYEKLDKLFSDEYESKRRSVDYNKLLQESGYIEANYKDGILHSAVPEGKEKDKHLFKDRNGDYIVKKTKDLSPELLTAINLYDEANKKRNTSVYVGNVHIDTRKDDEVIGSDDVPDEYISSLGIDKNDYLKWVNKNRRNESALYKGVKYLFKGDEEEEYFKEKKQYEKIKSYKASILNDISSDISVIDSRIKLSKDQTLKNKLKREREILQKEFLKNANQMNSAINLFPKYKEYTLDKDLERRKNLYYASRSGGKINTTVQGIEIAKTAFSAMHNFATNFFSIAGELPDELLFKAGFEDKGFFKGLSEVLTDSSESMDASFGSVQRRTVAEGKTVFYKNQEYIVDKNGSVLDSKTNVSVEGIVSDDDIKEIIKRSNNVKDTDLNLTVGSGLQGSTQTLANLFALIRAGGKTTKALGLKGAKAGNYGMGIASYISSVTGSVEDIRSQLVESGMSEQEALDISINAGNAIASLDGIFSGLAGSNTKLMGGLSGIKQEIINAAKTKGKDFSTKQFKDKAYELIKENGRELFVEEIPVLLSEKGINYLVNEHIGKEVLDDDINRGDIVETTILTIAATSTLGSTNLLSGNNRKDFIRGLAKDNNINLEGVLNKMVLDEQITEDQAYNVYKEVSSMRDADLKTSGTIFMSENVEKAADLIKQKELLQKKAKDIDGALKEDIDKKITSIDEQLKELKEKDKESAKKEYELNEFKSLPDNEKIKLKEEAANILLKEAQDAGKTEINITDNQISNKASEIFTKNKEAEIESPIKDNLQENETIVQTRKDGKGRVFTTTKKESVRERDGLKITKFEFNRGDKATDVRNNASVPEDVALSGTNLEINPEDRLDLQEGETATYEISEIREGDTGVGASVRFTVTDADGNQIESFRSDVRLVEKKNKETVAITPETSSNYANMTEDGEGNFVFYHVGQEGYSAIEPRTGDTRATSKEEAAALSKVGGLAMYYTSPETKETAVSGKARYQVKVPVDKVYDFNNDPLNFNEEGKKRHSEENPGKAYDNNTSLAYVTKIAGENGFDMVVADWNGVTRAQTTKALSPTDLEIMDGNTITKKFDNEYESNSKKGFESVIPETRDEKLSALYDKINKERNLEKRYDDLYSLRENYIKKSQDEITELIEGSDLSQEIKNEYKEILESKEEKRRSKKKSIKDDYASKEVDRVKELPKEGEDGATMNLDGSKYEDGGLVIPVASVNMKASDLTTEAIENFVQENSESIGADNVKVGIYKFPDSDMVSIDINIVADRSMREEALKIGKELGQESLFDLDTFENIKTGADGKNPKKLSPKEFLDVQERLKVKTTKVDSDGVSKLREMFSKTPDQRKQVDNALNALSKIAPDVKVILHESEQAYAEATGETGRKQKTSGTYDETIVDGKVEKVIHINPDKANARTVAHEAFHAIFLNIVKNDAEAQRLSAAMIKAVYKSAPAELKKLIDNFAESKNADGSNNYDSAVQNEEKLAELIGYLATEYDSLPKPTKNVIKKFLDRLAKMFGMKPFTDSEVIEVLNTIAKKVSTGEAITDQDVSVLKGGKVVSNPIKLIERKSVGGFDVQYTEANKIQELKDKNLLVEVNDVSVFSGFKTAITSPDDMLAGTISIDGKQIFEGGGGVFFVTKYGDVWASGNEVTANQLAKIINESLKINGDKGLLVLAKGDDQKLISSVSGVNSSLAILDVMLDKGFISPSDFRSSVSQSVKREVYNIALNEQIKNYKKKNKISKKDKVPAEKLIDLKVKAKKVSDSKKGFIKLSSNSKQLKIDIQNYFSDPSTTTFERRGNVVKDIIGRISQSKSVKENSSKIINLLGGDTNKKLGKGETKLTQSLGDLVAGIAAEQLTKGLSVGDVYGIIEVNSKVEVVEDSHPSYPFHIRIKDGSKPKLILPKNRQNGSEILKTSTGKTYRVGNVSVLSGLFNSDIKPITRKRKQINSNKKILESEVSKSSLRSIIQSVRKSNPYSSVIDILTDIYKGNTIEDFNYDYLNDEVLTYDALTDVLVSEEIFNSKRDAINKLSVIGKGIVFKDIESITRSRKQVNLAPNGKPSNLNQEQYDIVRTPKFKNWFGDWENDPENSSKVVDENGEPLVVYHGSTAVDIDIFDRSQSKRLSSGLKEFGTYFATNKKLAELYKQGDGRVYPIFLNIRDMVTFDAKEESNIEAWNNLKVKASYKTATNRDAMEFLSPVISKKRNLGRFGVDPVNGIKAENIIDMSPGTEDKNSESYKKAKKEYLGNVYLLFDGQPENAKLADGSNTTFDPDAPSIRKQATGRPSIDEVRKFAKENNISDADTNAYLKELGYTNKEFGITSTEIRERSEASIKAKKKKDASLATRTREKLLDRQARIKGLLKGIDSKESKQAVAKIVTKAGATGYASFRFKEAEEKIYKGLSEEEIKILDEMIYEIRIISINKNRADRGLDPYTGIEGYNEVSAQRDLDNKRRKLGDKKFEELKKRSDIYFTEFNKSLKRMFDSGLISEEVYNQLKDLDYSPIKTIKYIIPENSSSEEIDRVAISSGVTREAIKNLGDSNKNEIITDTKWLLATNLSMIEAKIFENKMLNAFEDAINSATEAEKIALNEYILDNPVVGKYKDGRPKRKYDEKYDNINYTKVYYKKDGVDKYFVMKKIYAEQLLDVKMKQSNTSDFISKITFTQVLRFFATSGNPLFIVGNTAVDFNNILFLSDTYSNFKLLGGAELAYDFVSNSLGKVFASDSYKKSYSEFMEHGGSIDYLSVDGLKALQNLDTGMKPIQKATDILKSFGKLLSYLGETSEISFRIAVYEKSKSNQLKKLGRKPTNQEMEDIMFEAAREARETIDFSQGGSATKAADKTLPYLNAATQGLRKGLDYANNNPVGFASNMLQASLMSGGLMAGSLYMLLSGLDDEDEIVEVLGRISDYEKANYHIIFTGNKDKDGEYEFYRIKKLPTISVFTTFADQLVIQAVLKSRGIDYDLDGDVMERSLKSAMPIIPTPKEFLQRNPMLSSVVTYTTNYDFFYDKPIFQGPRGKNIAPSSEGLYDSKVNQIYKDWGQATGMSPARSKAALEKIITSESTNPVVGLIYSGYDAAFKDDTAISEDFNKAKESLFKNITKKVKRKTNKNLKVYKERANDEEEVMIIETEIYNKEQKVYQQIVSKHKNNEELTNSELKNIVKENFDKKDWTRYYRKYYTMNKKKDVDRGLLDILYENTPEVQALKLFKRFGNSLDAEEYKELRKVSRAARRNLSKKAYKIYKDKYTK